MSVISNGFPAVSAAHVLSGKFTVQEREKREIERRENEDLVQGYLTHKKQRLPRTLQQDYVWGPMEPLGGGGCFL